jgi:hypothetical protein
MKSIATLVAFVAITSAAHATDSSCFVPSFVVEPGAPLKRVADAVKNDRKLSVVLFSGSPSQTGGTKGRRSYPAYLESALRERLPGVDVKIEVRAKTRQATEELVPLLPAALDELKPTLVVWQAGTVETLRQSDPEAFGQSLRQGLATIGKSETDTVLVNMQYSPRTDRLVDYSAYLGEIRDSSDAANVPLFDRYEIMRYWNVAGNFDLSSLRDDGLYEKIHVCIGTLLAEFILRGAGLRDAKGFGG